MNSSRISRILIIRLSSIGDICHGALILPSLKEYFPEAKITWAVADQFRPVVEKFIQVDDVFSFKIKKPFKNCASILKTIMEMRKTHYDLILDLQGLLKSGILAFLMKGKTIGFNSPVSRELSHWFYQKRIIVPPSVINIGEIYREMLKSIYRKFNFANNLPQLSLPDIKQESNGSLLPPKKSKKKFRVAINPWASFHTKEMPRNIVEELIRKLNKTNIELYLVNSPDHTEMVSYYQETFSDRDTVFLEITPKTNLGDFFSLIKEFDFFISTDSGPSYLAQLQGVPTLILFGPTNLDRQLPRFEGSTVQAIYSNYLCPIIHPEPISQAYRCRSKNCGNNQCMKQFSVDTIIEQVTIQQNQ